MQLCCHADAENFTNMYVYIMGKSSKQCSYAAMQLRNSTNMQIYVKTFNSNLQVFWPPFISIIIVHEKKVAKTLVN